MSLFCITKDRDGRILSIRKGDRLVVHHTYHDDNRPPYRTTCGDHAEQEFIDFRRATCQRLMAMASHPMFPWAQRVIATLKERGQWIEPR